MAKFGIWSVPSNRVSSWSLNFSPRPMIGAATMSNAVDGRKKQTCGSDIAPRLVRTCETWIELALLNPGASPLSHSETHERARPRLPCFSIGERRPIGAVSLRQCCLKTPWPVRLRMAPIRQHPCVRRSLSENPPCCSAPHHNIVTWMPCTSPQQMSGPTMDARQSRVPH